jgi:hypothetical protein
MRQGKDEGHLFFRNRLSSQTLLVLAIVNAKELISPGGHINLIRFSLRFLCHNKEINRIIRRRELMQVVMIYERFPKRGAPCLLLYYLSLLCRTGQRQDLHLQSCNRRAMVKKGNITYFRHELRAIGGTYPNIDMT